MENYDILTISNVTTKSVIAYSYGEPINLAYALNSMAASGNSNFEIRFAPGRTPFLIIKHVPTNTTGKLYGSGKLATIGSKSVDAARNGYDAIREFIANEGEVLVNTDELSVTSITAKVTTPFRINLDQLAQNNRFIAWEPESNPNAVVRRITVPDTTATVAVSGKINITASKQSATMQHLSEAWLALRAKLENARVVE
jgi:TATA-box binding protein (TBP) (component of TFIID and TFIIIB)